MAGEFIRVGDTLLAIGEIAAIHRNRHDPRWATVVLVNRGQEIEVHRPAAELIEDVGTLLRDGGYTR